jgi:tRNA threonylcarbamoyladenosine biosynthesis protein TsaE
MQWKSHSPAETRAFGERLARGLRAGDVVLLRGELGAGKSELARGIARGLGVTGYVTSPSFTILQVHAGGRLPLYHFDWYRLSDVEELYELSLDEYLYGDGVAVVEWPDRAPEAIPQRHLAITLEASGESGRRLTLMPVGGFPAPDEAVWEAKT